jgi:hypothetical protein
VSSIESINPYNGLIMEFWMIIIFSHLTNQKRNVCTSTW